MRVDCVKELGLASGSGTIAGVFPSLPQDDAWDADASRMIARGANGLPRDNGFDALPGPDGRGPSGEGDGDDAEEELEELEVVPVRRQLSLAIAGFAALLGAGL